MTNKNNVINTNKIRKDLEKEIQNEYSETLKEMVKEKMRTIKINENKIENIKEENKQIQKDIDNILKGRKTVTERDLIEYKGNQDFRSTVYLD